jgi:hypothetical protein
VRIASDPAGYLNLLLLLRKAAELGATCIVVLLTVRVMNDDGNVPIIVAGLADDGGLLHRGRRGTADTRRAALRHRRAAHRRR